MDPCKNYPILKSIESSLDRLSEAAWFIRMMEEHYHQADQFRWSLNSFLRAVKEVLQVLTMEVQGRKGVREWLKDEKTKLRDDPLIAFVYKQRDAIVHKTMLKPASKGMVGFTRGRGLKLGIGVAIDPLEDSESAVLRYIYFAAKDKDFLGLLYMEDDESGEYTCVQREWRLDKFPDKEITELAAEAWERVARVTLEAATRLGATVIAPEFKLGNPNHVQFEIYRPEWVKEQFERAKIDIASGVAKVT